MAVKRDEMRPIAGSERPQAPGSTLLGPEDASTHVTVTLLLRQRPGNTEPPDLQHWQDTPPDRRQFLSADEFDELYGGAEEDVEAVVDYLNSKGLRILDKHAGQRRIVAEGTRAEIEAAFAIKLQRYRVPHRIAHRPHLHGEGHKSAERITVEQHDHRGFEGPVKLPAALADIVTAVIGLDDRRLGGVAGTGTGDPPGATFLSPQTIAQRYNFPTNSAAGQTVGLFEDAASGAAYLATDIQLFLQGLPNGPPVPGPNFFDISKPPFFNNPANVASPNPSIQGAVLECTADVSIVGAVAPGVNINVYFTSNDEAGWDWFFHRATHPAAGENPPSVLSASWLTRFSDDPGTIGNPSLPGSLAHVFHRHLQHAAARGITVLMAIGDWGANNRVGPPDVLCHVSYPNADPWVTACGGTILGGFNPTPPPLLDEWAWSDANVASQFDVAPFDSTGGGVSDTFPPPPYQAAAGILPISKNDGKVRRGVPDVAGMVATRGFFVNGAGPGGFIGTSAVSPLYAGLVATINAFLGRNAGFLNPTLYTFGPQVCNDIVVGNNDSGNTPNSPFYTTDVGWDACTGWGSINGMRLLAALAPAPILVTTIPDGGVFADTCLDSFADEILTIDNSGISTLLIWNITSSLADFEVPGVASYPIAVSPGGSVNLVIRFKPIVVGPRTGAITIFSNDLFNPHSIRVFGTGVAPRLVLGIADSGSFGDVCLGSFRDEPLVVNNGGKCTLLISSILSSSGEFLPPSILSYPIAVAAGASVALPIRFHPTVLGPTPAGTHLTVNSNDPGGPRTVPVSGHVPSGKLAITGSTCFGEVPACCQQERTISVCNVGDCKLRVFSVAFKRESRHWKLINNPFPATLHPGSCLAVVIRYKADERFARACELVVTSDDPTVPVKTLDVLAATVWSDCCCQKCCDGCRRGECEKRHCEPRCCRTCHDDHDHDRHHDDD
jgi:Pro-kumamolisin, activation domain